MSIKQNKYLVIKTLSIVSKSGRYRPLEGCFGNQRAMNNNDCKKLMLNCLVK